MTVRERIYPIGFWRAWIRADWMLVNRDKHRIAKSPNGAWAMYCPVRGPDALIYADRFDLLAAAIGGSPCPHVDDRYCPPKLLTSTW